MKKVAPYLLATSLLLSVSAPLDSAYAASYTFDKNGKLVDSKTKKKVKGFKTHKGKVYKNGKLFKGVYKGKFYSKGKKSSSTFKGVKYRKGSIFTGKSVDGKYYDNGQIADGVASNGIMYDNGVIYTGSFGGVNYVNGKPVDDKIDDKVDETKPTEDNTNNNNNSNEPVPTVPEDNKEESNPIPPIEEVEPPVVETGKPSDNGNSNNTEDSQDELVLVDGDLYVNPKTGVHYVRGNVQTKSYQYDSKTSNGYFFTEEGKLDTIYTNHEYHTFLVTDTLLSFHVYTNNEIRDIYSWERERGELLENINSLPDSSPKKYLQGEYDKATQVAIDTYSEHQTTTKDKVNNLFEETHPYYFKEGRHKERLDALLNEIDDEDFKNQITEMVNNATEPPSN